MDSPQASEALDNLSKLLGKEPAAASESEDALEEELSDEDTMSQEDLDLMSDDGECLRLCRPDPPRAFLLRDIDINRIASLIADSHCS